MRIDAIRIRNFRGIEQAELDGLADAPLITVSGPNGAGKSLLFEAIALLWRIISVWERQRILASAVIGPWADTCDIEVAVVLSDEEQGALTDYLRRMGRDDQVQSRASMGFHLAHDDQPPNVRVEPWAAPLWTLDFTTTHGFANVDFFPADRSFPRGEHASVNPALLTDEQREGFRDQIISSFAQQRSLVNLSGIAPLLASLDYVDLLADREGRPQSGDFDALADAFRSIDVKGLAPTSPRSRLSSRVSPPRGNARRRSTHDRSAVER